jgi:hypothetical protein
LPGDVIRQAVAADVRAQRLLPQVLTAAVLDVAISIARDLDDLRALSSALGEDLAARANSGGQIVEIMHAHAHSIVLTYGHALDLTRADAVTHTCAADPELLRNLGLAPARALADAIAGDLADTIARARATAAELATVIDQDLNVLSAFEFDLARAIELHRVHAAAVERADSIAHEIPLAPGLDLADVFGASGGPELDPAFPVPAMLGLPLRWVADSSLASTLLQVLAARPGPGDPYLAFAYALSSRAGVFETTQLGAALGGPLTDALDGLAKATPSMRDGSADWQLVMGLSRLADRCGPMSTAHLPPEPAEAAALRAVALALADGAAVPGADAPAVLRTAAATVTLVERRGKGESAAGESVILALV